MDVNGANIQPVCVLSHHKALREERGKKKEREVPSAVCTLAKRRSEDFSLSDMWQLAVANARIGRQILMFWKVFPCLISSSGSCYITEAYMRRRVGSKPFIASSHFGLKITFVVFAMFWKFLKQKKTALQNIAKFKKKQPWPQTGWFLLCTLSAENSSDPGPVWLSWVKNRR